MPRGGIVDRLRKKSYRQEEPLALFPFLLRKSPPLGFLVWRTFECAKTDRSVCRKTALRTKPTHSATRPQI